MSSHGNLTAFAKLFRHIIEEPQKKKWEQHISKFATLYRHNQNEFTFESINEILKIFTIQGKVYDELSSLFFEMYDHLVSNSKLEKDFILSHPLYLTHVEAAFKLT